jgi:hypothetical protein
MATNFIIKFACVPSKFAPKRKFVNFSLPKFRQKLGEFKDPDMASWINNLYQDRTFKTRDEFNQAYDFGDSYTLNWGNKPMVITNDDLTELSQQFESGAFDDGEKAQIEKLIGRMRTVMSAEKVVFVY